MMLGFKRRFAPYVHEGSKTHTIRANCGRTWKAGMRCDCYVDPRQKSMRLLGRFTCVKVEDIVISREPRPGTCETHPWLFIEIEGICLEFDEANEFAYRDGFRELGRRRALEAMTMYWIAEMRRHPTHRSFPFVGHVIHWKFEGQS
jgi:hypothetical protein